MWRKIIKHPEIDANIYGKLIFKQAKTISGEMIVLSTKGAGQVDIIYTYKEWFTYHIFEMSTPNASETQI